jgi:hypothetical protein
LSLPKKLSSSARNQAAVMRADDPILSHRTASLAVWSLTHPPLLVAPKQEVSEWVVGVAVHNLRAPSGTLWIDSSGRSDTTPACSP